ncbi:MAG: phenylacetic acid degradation operon negative regulatory protein [Mycobacteriales bacterium]|jgi:phenylacetic acid degradation operon negative regulatory protein
MPADARRPVVSRRREVSHASARSLLMTILGEYMLPRDQPAWTSTLVETLGLFDVEDKSARQALTRTAAEGWLVSERAGRRVRWSLTPPGRRLLTEGAQRIYTFGRDESDWDGIWVVLLVSVPESQRDLRHQLRTRLTWAGFGSPAAGAWISPHSEREPEAKQIVAELTPDAPAMSFLARYGQVGAEDALVARAWDLTDVEERYERFIDDFTGLGPATGAAVLYQQTRLVHEWRRFPFLDPRLPRRLLPRNWSGVTAARLFHDNHQRWREPAQDYWDRRLAADSAIEPAHRPPGSAARAVT